MIDIDFDVFDNPHTIPTLPERFLHMILSMEQIRETLSACRDEGTIVGLLINYNGISSFLISKVLSIDNESAVSLQDINDHKEEVKQVRLGDIKAIRQYKGLRGVMG